MRTWHSHLILTVCVGWASALGASALLIASGLTTRAAAGANGPGGSALLERLAGLAITLLATVVGTGYTWHLWNATQRPAQGEDRGPARVLSYPIEFRVFAGFTVASGIFILGVALPYMSPDRPRDVAAVFVMCTLFILVGNLAFIETGEKIFLSLTGIRQRSGWGQCRLIRWEDVVELSYEASGRRFEITGKQGEKIGFYDFLNGMPTLIRVFQASLPPRIHHRALHEYWHMPAVEPKNPVISLVHDPITFETRGWRTFEDQPFRRVWTNDDGDRLRLRLIEDAPKLPARPAEADALRDYFGHLLANAGGALISLDEVHADGVPAIQTIAQYPRGPRGLVYVGSFIIPFRDFSYVVRILCRKDHPTGYRGAAATDRPPLLRNLSGDEGVDATLPEGPLSWVRGVMRDIEATLRLSPAVKAQPPFTGPAYHRL